MKVLRIAFADLKRVAKDRMALLWLLAMPLVDDLRLWQRHAWRRPAGHLDSCD